MLPNDLVRANLFVMQTLLRKSLELTEKEMPHALFHTNWPWPSSDQLHRSSKETFRGFFCLYQPYLLAKAGHQWTPAIDVKGSHTGGSPGLFQTLRQLRRSTLSFRWRVHTWLKLHCHLVALWWTWTVNRNEALWILEQPFLSNEAIERSGHSYKLKWLWVIQSK